MFTRISNGIRNLIALPLALMALALIYVAKAIAAVEIQVTHDMKDGFNGL